MNVRKHGGGSLYHGLVAIIREEKLFLRARDENFSFVWINVSRRRHFIERATERERERS